MKHPDSDLLLQAILETLEEPEQSSVQQHISGCPECARLMKELESQVQMITGVNLITEEFVPPRLPERNTLRETVLKAAAVLVLGFLIGYATALLTQREQCSVVGQRLQPTTVQPSTMQLTPSEAIDCRAFLYPLVGASSR